MGQFYVDDSIHDEAGFIIGACIYTEIDIAEKVTAVIRAHGFDLAIFEYKSSDNYSKEPAKAKVRSDLKELLRYCQLGIIAVPRVNRDQFGYECIKGLKQFIEQNEHLSEPIDIYFDQGMFGSTVKAKALISNLAFKDCTFNLEQNSSLIRGIQIADLAAHVSSIQLKDKMGLINKMVTIPAYAVYEAQETELGFEMWATLRNCFFHQRFKEHVPEEDNIKRVTLSVEPYGLYISELCSNELAETSRNCFAKVYKGCIH